jgi:hypothetical protein
MGNDAYADGNVAFKCTYCDGSSARPADLGFDGTCSAETMRYNVARRVWCGSAESPCRLFVDNGLCGKPPRSPCYESTLFARLRFGTGVYHSGPDEGRIDKPAYVQRGKVALLTTRRPGAREKERVVFGAFLVVRQSDGDGRYYVQGERTSFFRAPPNAVLPYWTFKTPPPSGGPAWGSHLYRYLTDCEVASYLKSVHARVRGELRDQVRVLQAAVRPD